MYHPGPPHFDIHNYTPKNPCGRRLDMRVSTIEPIHHTSSLLVRLQTSMDRRHYINKDKNSIIENNTKRFKQKYLLYEVHRFYLSYSIAIVFESVVRFNDEGYIIIHSTCHRRLTWFVTLGSRSRSPESRTGIHRRDTSPPRSHFVAPHSPD